MRTPSTTSGPVQPFGVSNTIAGQRGVPVKPDVRRGGLDRPDRADAAVEARREVAVHLLGLVAGNHVDVVAVCLEQGAHLVVRLPAEDGGPADLVAVEVQDREHRAVADRVQEADALPRALERGGLGLAVADHTGHDEVGVVEHRAERVGQGVAQLAALVDGPRRRHAHVARDAAGRGELAEEALQPDQVGAHLRVDLGVGALEEDVGHERGPAVPGPGHVDHVEVVAPDHAVEVGVQEAEPGRGAPVAEQPGLHVLGSQRLAQQRVGAQVDLADGEVVGGAPPRVEEVELGVVQRWGHGEHLDSEWTVET